MARGQKTYADLHLDAATKSRIGRLALAERELIQGLQAETESALRARIGQLLLDLCEAAAASRADPSGVGDGKEARSEAGDSAVGGPARSASNEALAAEVRSLKELVARQQEVIDRQEHERLVDELAGATDEYGPDAKFLLRCLVERAVLGEVSERTDRMATLRLAYFDAFAQCRDSVRAARAADPSRLVVYQEVLDSLQSNGGQLLARLSPVVAEVLKTVAAESSKPASRDSKTVCGRPGRRRARRRLRRRPRCHQVPPSRRRLPRRRSLRPDARSDGPARPLVRPAPRGRATV